MVVQTDLTIIRKIFKQTVGELIGLSEILRPSDYLDHSTLFLNNRPTTGCALFFLLLTIFFCKFLIS